MEWSVHGLVGGDQLSLDLEGVAEAIRRRAGYESDDFASAVRVAGVVLGEPCIVYDAGLSGPAYLRARADGRFEIVLRPGASDVRFRLLHETAHVELQRLGIAEQLSRVNEELAANYVAAAIAAPRMVVERAANYYGRVETVRHLPELARAFGLSQTSVQLRLSEVVGDERAVVTATHQHVLRRGWSEAQVRKAASGDRPGLAKVVVRLEGGLDQGRIALLRR